MSSRPDFLSSGAPSKLFPVVADSKREQRTLSILLAVLTKIPVFYEEIFGSIGVRTGKRTQVSTFTEVGLRTDLENSDRPGQAGDGPRRRPDTQEADHHALCRPSRKCFTPIYVIPIPATGTIRPIRL